MILLRRRQHGQPAVARPAQRWIDRGLIYADLLTTYPANTITGQPDTITGTKVTTTPWGLARGFGTTVGVASTDRVLTTLLGTVALRTILVRYVRAGAGGGSAGRVFDNAQEQANYSDGTSLLSYSRAFSTTDGAWTTPASGVGTATNTPFVFAIAYDARSTANNPAIYINGSPVTVTRATAPVGTFTAGSTAYSLGNRAAGDRAFNGSLSDFLVFDSVLTDGEIAELADPSRVWADRRIWVPVSIASGGGATGTLAATETGSDTASFAGDVLIDGTLTASETGSDTATLAGDVLIDGTLAATESGSDTAAFTGTSAVVTTGTLAATETGSDTAAFAGDVLIDGALAATEGGSDTAAFAGDVLIDGTLAATESGSDTAAFTGTAAAAISGTLAASESGGDTAAFTNVTATRDGEGGGEGRIRRGVKPKRKPKYLIEVDGKFVVVDSPEEARQVLSPKPVKKGKKAAKKAAPAPSIAPIIDLGRVEDYADLIGEIEQFDAAMQSRHYQQILAMFDQMQDDEDVELLLLAL